MFFCRMEGGGGGGGDAQQSIIPSQDSLIGDLLSMDINPPQVSQQPTQAAPYATDLLGGGLDALVRKFF